MIVIGAVDIGGTKIAVGIVNDSGMVLSKLQSPNNAEAGYSNALARMVSMLRENARISGVEISGIGIGSTGMVYGSTGVIGDADFLPGWKGCNPVKDLAGTFNVSAALETAKTQKTAKSRLTGTHLKREIVHSPNKIQITALIGSHTAPTSGCPRTWFCTSRSENALVFLL